MISKKEFKRLVETVVADTGKTQEELAIAMNYGKNYISEVLSPTGKMTEKFSNAFLSKYGHYLENPKRPAANGVQRNPKPIRDTKRKIPFYDAPAEAGLTET